MKFTRAEIEKLSSKKALYHLMKMEKPDYQACLQILDYEKELKQLQIELIKLQNWVVENEKRILIIIEGGEFAGKSQFLRAFNYHLNPRASRTVALPKPNDLEQHQWYFRRYVKQLPQKSEIVLFDRSWYNRAVLEPTNGFCSKSEYQEFMNEVNNFENLICSNQLQMFKIYFKISKKEQERRLKDVKANPLRYWELTEVDKNAQKLWTTFKKYERIMLKRTHTDKNPWLVLDANNKYQAHLKAIKYVLSNIKYK